MANAHHQRTEELLALNTPTSKEQAFENLFEVFQSYVQRLSRPAKHSYTPAVINMKARRIPIDPSGWAFFTLPATQC